MLTFEPLNTGKGTGIRYCIIFEAQQSHPSVMKISRKSLSVLLIMLSLAVTSCLTVEKKEYTFEFTGENSGTLTIRYINILSVMDDTTDVSAADFQELLDKYIEGDQLSQDYPGATNLRKKLYEDNGRLCAEIVLDFPDLAAARLYQYDRKSPLMLCISAAYDSETYVTSNGTFGNDYMPVVFWPSGSKKLELTTSITAVDETTIPLVEAYRNWKKQQ